MPYSVSNDVDGFLRSADKAAARTAILAASTTHAASHLPGGSDAITGMVTSTGTPAVGDILWHGASGWVHQRAIDDQYDSAVMMWDGGTRYLYDGTGVLSVDFGDKVLYSQTIPSLNWTDGISVLDLGSNAALEASSAGRFLYDFGGFVALSFSDRNLLSNSGVTTLSWNDGVFAYDTTGTVVMEGTGDNRLLYDFSSTFSVDFGYRTLFNPDSNAVLNWTYDFLCAVYGPASNSLATLAALGTQTFAPASGTTVTPVSDAAKDLTLNLNHAATIATLTVALATWLNSVGDGARITIFARSAVTTLTVTAAGYTLIGTAATTLAAGTSIEYVKVGSSRTAPGTPGQLLRVR
jgi:hypothetical protein